MLLRNILSACISDLMADKLLTTPEVARRLGVTQRRVLALIEAGRLPSKQYGRDHVIREKDIELVAVRKWGRPSKEESEKRRKKRAAAKD
jgi:excisionase family DNA binding protein